MQGCNFWRFGLIRSIALMSTTFLNHGRFLNHIWISIYLQPIIPNIIRLGKTQKYRLFSTNATTDSTFSKVDQGHVHVHVCACNTQICGGGARGSQIVVACAARKRAECPSPAHPWARQRVGGAWDTPQ